MASWNEYLYSALPDQRFRG